MYLQSCRPTFPQAWILHTQSLSWGSYLSLAFASPTSNPKEDAALCSIENPPLGTPKHTIPELDKPNVQFLSSLPDISDFLNWNPSNPNPFILSISPLLFLKEEYSSFCSTPGQQVPLRRCKAMQRITIITATCQTVSGNLVIGYCYTCNAQYNPDRIMRHHPDGSRQFYLYDAEYLRVSKSDMLWIHCGVAKQQEYLTLRKVSWQGFTEYFNRCFNGSLTGEQSQRLFLEHFIRRLGTAYKFDQIFNMKINPDVKELVKEANQWFLRGGILPGSLEHTCEECTHLKRQAGLQEFNGSSDAVADVDQDSFGNLPLPQQNNQIEEDTELLAQMPAVESPPRNVGDDDERYIQAVVMDGIRMGHKICAYPGCQEPLQNYKTGRFCARLHIDLEKQCGIVDCTHPTREGSKACSLPEHEAFFQGFLRQFARISMHGLR
ncbi:hypothetical protein M422DRAFT_49464 [Sphaerobolus stellatus SS14]|uniref:Uncharacterized protein n=1 Tax=Sphaerobolus stellatus (strain SS14) TaxID=990650 RepID=A0A0C9VPB2_SPHS4|nr:hypothetical protein M422DRAFT_49464 [Sphaerobolus stellatus SS14]